MSTLCRPLRVLLVAASYFPYTGGLETHVYEVGRRLARDGVEVTILTTDLSKRLPTAEETGGVRILRVRAWPSTKDYYFAPGIYRIITHGQWDLIHCQGYHNFVPPLAMLAALRANIPYVLSFHSGGDVTRLRKMLRGLQCTLLRPLLSRARKLIAVSQFEADFFQERLRLPNDKFVVIPNGAQLTSIQEQADSKIGGSDDAPLIVSVGRLERYKGHHRAIMALPKVLEQVPDARLRIVGTGPYEMHLQEMARKLGVERQVEIRSIASEDRSVMASLLTRASLITSLSEYESQGIAVMEALVLQCPALVASSTALKELADRGLARAIPLESTPEEVADAVISQLRSPLVPQDFSLPTWEACAASLLSLYQSIAGRATCAS
ncbi:MAG TPA: glycosyltransferase family 4 protein [Ktedonobacteraceae bacterium]